MRECASQSARTLPPAVAETRLIQTHDNFRAAVEKFRVDKRSRGAEVYIYGDPPRFKQRFWDVTSVSVPFAPLAQFGRKDVRFRVEV